MRPMTRYLILPAALAVSLSLPLTALAFPAGSCTLSISSLDAGGTAIDAAASGTLNGNLEDPILVAQNGTVHWEGTSGDLALINLDWGVSSFGIPLPVGGHEANDGGDTAADGNVAVDEALPFAMVGLFHVTATARGDDGVCEGSAWFRLQGDAWTTFPFWLALVLLVLGVLLLVRGDGGVGQGLVAGLFLGLAAAILTITFGVMPVNEWTPWVWLALGLILGAASGPWLTRRRTQTVVTT